MIGAGAVAMIVAFLFMITLVVAAVGHGSRSRTRDMRQSVLVQHAFDEVPQRVLPLIERNPDIPGQATTHEEVKAFWVKFRKAPTVVEKIESIRILFGVLEAFEKAACDAQERASCEQMRNVNQLLETRIEELDEAEADLRHFEREEFHGQLYKGCMG